MRITSTFRVVSGLLLAAALVFAQETPPSDKPPAEKPPSGQIGGLRFLDVSEVTVVNVEVTVTDKKGPVLDLKPSEFEVFQDGRVQELTNFAVFTRATAATPTPAAAPTPAATPGPTSVPAAPTPEPTPAARRESRFVAFYVDNEYVLPMNRNRVINKVADWVYTYLKPPDQAMVVSYQRSLKVLQPFTSEPDAVAAALRAMKRYTG